MANNTIGSANTAMGIQSLASSATGNGHTALGANALGQMSTGDVNTAVGSRTLPFLFDGSFNIALGYSAGAAIVGTANYNIFIGSEGVNGDNNTIRIGDGNQTATYIAGILGSPGDMAVGITKDGRLGITPSSRRFKEHIEPVQATGIVQALRPVSFYYKADFAPGERVKQYGLVAEEVAAISPDLVVRDMKGEVLTVRYQALAPLLVAEVQRLERERAAMAAELAALRTELAALSRR
jgi:hypothetical protein